MYNLTKGTFIKELNKATTEEEVKFAYVKEFKIKFSAAYKQDLYTPQILFEFKYDKNFENVKTRAASDEDIASKIQIEIVAMTASRNKGENEDENNDAEEDIVVVVVVVVC